MSELDRELILAERTSRINDYKLKQTAKRMRQQGQPEQVSTSHIEGNSELTSLAAVQPEDVQMDPTAPRQELANDIVAASSQLGTTAQDVSADNLQISNPSNENDTTSSALSLGTLPDEVKAKLRTMLGLLNQDIVRLVQDAEPIRDIFKSIRGHLLRETAEKLLQAAYIESRQFQVLDAQSRLEDRARQEQIIKAREAHDSRAADLDGKIHMLNSSRADIVGNINRLKQRRADLMKELREVGEELVREEEKLNNLPNVIADLEKDKIISTQKAQALRRKERLILGTADADRRDIGGTAAPLLQRRRPGHPRAALTAPCSGQAQARPVCPPPPRFGVCFRKHQWPRLHGSTEVCSPQRSLLVAGAVRPAPNRVSTSPVGRTHSSLRRWLPGLPPPRAAPTEDALTGLTPAAAPIRAQLPRRWCRRDTSPGPRAAVVVHPPRQRC